MRTCGSEECEFSFEELALGNIFAELKNEWQSSEMLILTAIYAFQSGSAVNYTEPFPTILLKSQEIRTKRGNLDSIQKTREAGRSIKEAQKVDNNNKDI